MPDAEPTWVSASRPTLILTTNTDANADPLACAVSSIVCTYNCIGIGIGIGIDIGMCKCVTVGVDVGVAMVCVSYIVQLYVRRCIIVQPRHRQLGCFERDQHGVSPAHDPHVELYLYSDPHDDHYDQHHLH